MKPVREWNRTGLVGVILLVVSAGMVLFAATRPVAAALAAAGAVCVLLMDGPPKLPGQKGDPWRVRIRS